MAAVSLTPSRRSRGSSDNFTSVPRPRISIQDNTLPTSASERSSLRPETPIDGPASATDGVRIHHSRQRSGTLREQKAKWKYGKYTEERAEGKPISRKQTENGDLQKDTSMPDLSLTESHWGQNALERRKRRIQNKVLGRKASITKQDQDEEIDVLYENQRGAFFCGIPFFSPKALNPADPSPWVDGGFNKSRENITNAQVPDPSWEWVWRTWYVDMSRDVDEEGWEYSFFFKGFSFHGTHPWFHSFVRRRRWIRKRVRRHHIRDMTDPHGLTKDYFTIHTGRLRAASSLPTTPTSERRNSKKWGVAEKDAWEEDEIVDIGTLMHALKVAPVDSERISLIKHFIEHGGDDLFYLADEIPNIMSYFFHEHSSRRLLVLLQDKIASADSHLQEHEKSGEPQNAEEKQYTNALLKAANAVDEQCKKLQFWSDSLGMPRVSKVSFDIDEQKGLEENGSKKEKVADRSSESYETAKEVNDTHSVSSSTDSIRRSTTKNKGKAPLVANEEYINVGGFDGAFDDASPPTPSVPPIIVSDMSNTNDEQSGQNGALVTRSRASRTSLRRKSSTAESVQLAELSPEPVGDGDNEIEESEEPAHIKAHKRHRSLSKSSNNRHKKSGSVDKSK